MSDPDLMLLWGSLQEEFPERDRLDWCGCILPFFIEGDDDFPAAGKLCGRGFEGSHFP